MFEDKSLRVAYGEALVEMGKTRQDLVVLDADLAHATMTSLFAAQYPGRFYNFGIAEANMVCAAAGLAHAGLTPFVSTFALFGAGRAFEQIRNAVCYTNANVKFGFSHSGLCVGEDGGSHQAVEDIALMRALPNMTVLVPCDPLQTAKAVEAALAINGPVYLRVARPVCRCITTPETPFIPGRANLLRQGKDVAIFATGLMVEQALLAAETLAAKGVEAAVVDFHTLKPFDAATALAMAESTGAVVTAEEHSVIGGLASATAEALVGKTSAKVANVAIMDKFGKSGTPADLFREYGLTAQNIGQKCMEIL